MGNGTVEGVRLIHKAILDGQMQPVPGSEFVEPCDMVIKATSQTQQTHLLNLIPGLQLDGKGRIIATDRTSQTTNPEYFAADDALSEGAEEVNAAAEVKVAARSIPHICLPTRPLKAA